MEELKNWYVKKIRRKMWCPSCNNYSMLLKGKSDTWRCVKCGYSVPEKDLENGYIFWFCDNCKSFLNNQEGFDYNAETHVCTECGFNNDITDANVFGMCKFCGELLDDPDADVCPECRQRRIKTAIIIGVSAVGVVALGYFGYKYLVKPQRTQTKNKTITIKSEKINSAIDTVKETAKETVNREGLPKTIYTTSEYNGYGKQNYYRYKYMLNGDEVSKYKCHRYKIFNGHENEWINDERKIESWNIKDKSIPEWLRKYI